MRCMPSISLISQLGAPARPQSYHWVQVWRWILLLYSKYLTWERVLDITLLLFDTLPTEDNCLTFTNLMNVSFCYLIVVMSESKGIIYHQTKLLLLLLQ